MTPVRIQFFTDILCIWAYAAERRVAELVETFGDRIEIEPRFCSVFPDAHGKIEQVWKDRGSYDGFNRHTQEVAARFDHISVNEGLWRDVRPRTSGSAHLIVKAVEVIERDTPPMPYLDRKSTQLASALREAFFANGRDISDWQELRRIAESLGLDYGAIRARVTSSEAMAALAADMNLAQAQGITGSPTFLMNEGRQRLFGNVGYRLLEANVQELLRGDAGEAASWC